MRGDEAGDRARRAAGVAAALARLTTLGWAAALLVAACGRGEPPPPAGDTAAAPPAATVDSAPAAEPPATAPAPAPDTTPAVDRVAASHHDGNPAARDTTPVPTAAELAELRVALQMPLEGVDPTKLEHTFDEPRGDGTRRHEALDIPAPRGTPVRSAAAGRVLRLYTSDAGGLMVYAADPSERFVLMYAHLDGYAPGLHDGAPLKAGDTIGYVGTTGNAPPGVPHLHFAIARVGDVSRWWTGTPVDPRPLLQP